MPFIQTALIHNEEEDILNFGGYKTRVIGSGNLDAVLYDLNSLSNQPLATLPVSSTNEDEPTRLANFNTQRAMLRLSTNQINEWFDITRIILYIKPLWMSYNG